MINLEYYKDEIVEKSKSKYGGRNVGCVLCEMRNKTYNCLNPCSQCIEESLEWLLEEHKELPVKTYKDDFFEKFPQAHVNPSGAPKCCRNRVYGLDSCEYKSCSDCWEMEMEL